MIGLVSATTRNVLKDVSELQPSHVLWAFARELGYPVGGDSHLREMLNVAVIVSIADNVAFWRERADSTRAAAWEMPDQQCRDGVLAIADSYERMARMAQARLARHASTARARLALKLAAPMGGGLALALACALAWL